MAVGGFVLAVPVLADPARRERLPAILLVLGLALGAWGLAQWFLDIPYSEGGDVGVRDNNVAFTSAGRGQLQGGLFVYPIAVVLAMAALISGHIRGSWPWLLTLVALGANVLCLIFTYERTFWGAAVAGCALVALRAAPIARRRALILVPTGVAVLLLALAAAAPGELRTALERGSSVTQARVDSSVEYRQVESRGVLESIAARPFEGSGFGAEFSWRQPGLSTPHTTAFVHNGYLWLAWKLGIPFAALVVALIAATVMRGEGGRHGSLMGALRTGAQGSLLGLLIVNVTFPSFNALSVAALTGLLIAMCWVPRRMTSDPVSSRHVESYPRPTTQAPAATTVSRGASVDKSASVQRS